MLRDRLVCGMNYEGIINLLIMEKVTFDKALKLAQAIESAVHDKTVESCTNQHSVSAPQHHTGA